MIARRLVSSIFRPVIVCAASVGLMAVGCKNGENKNTAKDSTKVVAPAETGPGVPIKYENGKRYIFLAFDDGPQPPGTINCKNIFASNGVKATFFLVGAHQFDPLRKRIVDSLNNAYPQFLTANHSSTHGFRDHYREFYAHPDSAVEDMLKAEKDLKLTTKIIRLPGMNTWAGKDDIKGPKSSLAVARRLDSLGYTIIGWDVEWRFARGSVPIQSADQMVGEVNKMFDQGLLYQPNMLVILAHDRMFAKPQYADSLNKFISTLKKDPRNVFETLDHYPTVQDRKK